MSITWPALLLTGQSASSSIKPLSKAKWRRQARVYLLNNRSIALKRWASGEPLELLSIKIIRSFSTHLRSNSTDRSNSVEVENKRIPPQTPKTPLRFNNQIPGGSVLRQLAITLGGCGFLTGFSYFLWQVTRSDDQLPGAYSSSSTDWSEHVVAFQRRPDWIGRAICSSMRLRKPRLRLC